MEDRPPIWRVVANTLNKQSQKDDKGWFFSLGVGPGAENSSPKKNGIVTKHTHVPRTWTDTVVRPKEWKRDMRFGTWHVSSLPRSESLTATARELEGYKLDLVHIYIYWYTRADHLIPGLIFF